MVLGGAAVVRLLRSLLAAVTGVSDGCILADGLLDCGEPASCVCSAGRRERGRRTGASSDAVSRRDRFIMGHGSADCREPRSCLWPIYVRYGGTSAEGPWNGAQR